jgi:acetoin utilization deacetylase AcuC-like enzyme
VGHLYGSSNIRLWQSDSFCSNVDIVHFAITISGGTLIKVIYNEKQVANSGSKVSPSASKSKYLAELLQKEFSENIEIVEPIAISLDDIKRCHDHKFVDDIMSLKEANGFGTKSQSVVDSLPYTNGAVYQGAKLAIEEKVPVAALVAGFHHSGYKGFEGLGYFCTFNGLMVAATKLVEDDGFKRVVIVDCDMHWGNGTDDILDRIDVKREKYKNISFGRYFHLPYQADDYLRYFDKVREEIKEFSPDVIIFQSGMDVHINDPFGGMLTEQQIYDRDIKMFQIAKDLNIPITWNLAGGYQVDKDGKCDYILHLHLNTFKGCKEVFG